MSLFPLCELRHFLTSDFIKVYRQWVPCKRNSLYNFNPFFMQLCTSFFHGLKMCMWFAFNPAVNFYHFSTLLTLPCFRRCDINFTKVQSIFKYGIHSNFFQVICTLNTNCVSNIMILAQVVIQIFCSQCPVWRK